MPLPDEKRHPNQESLGPQTRVQAFEAVQRLVETKRDEMTMLLTQMGRWFWEARRREQVAALLESKRGMRLTQKDVGVVMGVSDVTVLRIKRRNEEHPGDLHPRIGRHSYVRDVFPDVEAFIANEIEEGRSVTTSILVDFIITRLRVSVKRRTAREYLESHGNSLVSAVPTEDLRVNVDRDKLVDFYNNTLPAALDGVDPALVFNIDEMGSERYADRKRIDVIVPSRSEFHPGMLVGIPRTSYRCTLIACVALDGSRLKPAIITKNKTVNTIVFEKGYDTNALKLYHTKNSFITGEVFGHWLNDVFIPYVEEKREVLRRQRGDFNERAVLIMDGCTSHKLEQFQNLLESKNITPVFLVPHSSHMTQPLDLGIFGRLKSLIRNEASYTIPVQEMDGAAEAAENAEDRPNQAEPQTNRPPRGTLLAGCIVAILDAFEKATTRRLVVSAFSQAGIAYMIPDPKAPDVRVTYVDPGLARAVREFGLFSDLEPRHRPESGRVSIADLNLNSERVTADEGGENGERSTLPALGALDVPRTTPETVDLSSAARNEPRTSQTPSVLPAVTARNGSSTRQTSTVLPSMLRGLAARNGSSTRQSPSVLPSAAARNEPRDLQTQGGLPGLASIFVSTTRPAPPRDLAESLCYPSQLPVPPSFSLP